MYHDPKAYEFNDADRAEYAERFWQMPVRLADDGILRDLWRRHETSRGGGAATSLLPLLALHAFPTRRLDDAVSDGVTVLPAPAWTTTAYLSRRRMAAVSGLSRETVRRGLEHLEDRGLLQLFDSERHGLPKKYYRLADTLFPKGEEPFAQIAGSILYSGLWAMLPINSARHIYLVAAAVERREGVSIARLERMSGLSHRTTHEAISVLTNQKAGGLLHPKTNALNKEIGTYWSPLYLNNPDEIERVRRAQWPDVFRRFERAKAQAYSRKLRRKKLAESRRRKVVGVP